MTIDEQPRRHWKTSDEDSLMTCYLGMKERISIRELISHFEENYPHIDPMHVMLNFSAATWDEPPTAEDLAHRENTRRWKDERQAKWEKETYLRLKEKFENA